MITLTTFIPQSTENSIQRSYVGEKKLSKFDRKQ